LLTGVSLRILVLLALEFALLGIWMIREGMRRGYYLRIELQKDMRKLGFGSA
jgi:hypothetical protein